MSSQRTSSRIALLLAGLGALIILAACAPPQLPATPSVAETPTASETISPTEPSPTPIHPTLPPPSIPEKKVTPVRKLSLTDTTWQLENYVVNGVSKQALPDYPATLTLQDGEFSGKTGCNGLSGAYTVQGNAIHFELGPMTMRACLEDVADQEAAYLAGLQNAATFRVESGKLMLYDAQGNLLLTFAQQQPISLTDSFWQLIAFNNGKGGMESNLATGNITAQFGEDGRLSGNAGCNRYAAGYQMDGEKLTVSEIAVTQMFCNDPEGVMQTENTYLKNLRQAAAFHIEGDRLTIFDQDGGKLLEFRHVAEPALTDVTWRLTSMAMDEDLPATQSHAEAMNRVEITFTKDGQVMGSAGCNRFKSQYQVEGEKMAIRPPATARKMCDEATMYVERQFLRNLERVETYQIEEGQLILFGADSDLLAFFPAP